MIDWVQIFRRARRKNSYSVINYHHKDFPDFQKLAQELLKNKRRGEDGNVVNWLLVKSFECMKTTRGVIFYRYDFSADFKKIHVFGRDQPNLSYNLLHAYNDRIPITAAKKNDLKKLCDQKVIPAEVHDWFANLPTSNREKD